MIDQAVADLSRRIARMVVVATVIDVDRASARARVEWSEGVVSDWLSLAQLGSEELPFWIPPVAGTQVVVLSPGGDTTKGIIYPGPFKSAPPAGNFTGTLAGSGDVIVDDISHVSHTHGGIDRGNEISDGPE